MSFGQSNIEGVKVGLNFADVSGRSIANFLNNQSIITFNAGMFANLNIAGLLALQPELLTPCKATN